MAKQRYFVNDKTRFCKIITGPYEIEKGFREVTLEEMEEFRSITKIALDNGWNKSPRSFEKYLNMDK